MKKQKTVFVPLNPKAMAMVNAHARRLGVSVDEALRDALESFLAARGVRLGARAGR